MAALTVVIHCSDTSYIRDIKGSLAFIFPKTPGLSNKEKEDKRIDSIQFNG